MPEFNWKELLSAWCREILASNEYNYTSELPGEVLAAGWLGFPGASEAQIVQAEKRLGLTLPPSYREFLKISNGWRKTTPFIDKIWPVEEIEWFSRRHQSDWIDPWIEGGGGIIYPVSDEEYFVYGPEQDATTLRLEYLQTALEISPPGDAAIYLLNSKIVGPDGEWEAWFFASWLPGANRYRSFYEMMQAEHETFLVLKEAKTGTATGSKATAAKPANLIQRILSKFTH